MELQQLRYFLAVARLGHFTRAAEACGVAQPSLSHQIQKLEEEMGQSLVTRSRAGARLTPAGEVLARHAARVLDAVGDAEQAAQALRRQKQERLRIGCIPTVAPYLLPGVLAEVLGEFPALELAVTEDVTVRLFAALEAGELDLVVAAEATAPLDLAHRRQMLRKEPLLLAMPQGHPLTRLKKIRPEDLAGARLVALHEEHCLAGSVRAFCEANALPGHVVCRGAQLETLLHLVAAGVGVSLVPRMACADRWGPQVVFAPVAGAQPARDITAYWPSAAPLGAPAKAVVERMKAE